MARRVTGPGANVHCWEGGGVGGRVVGGGWGARVVVGGAGDGITVGLSPPQLAPTSAAPIAIIRIVYCRMVPSRIDSLSGAASPPPRALVQTSIVPHAFFLDRTRGSGPRLDTRGRRRGRSAEPRDIHETC